MFNVDANLDTIITTKREQLAKRQEQIPYPAVVALADMQKQPRSIMNVVTDGDQVVVLGQIKQEETYDPVAAALRYTRLGLDGVSVFTDERVYSRGMDDLLLVSRAVRNSPVLLQDYIINEYHVTEARAAGASSLMLYASILDQTALRGVVSLTQRWQMTAIVQVGTVEDMEYVGKLSPHVIAVGESPIFDRDRDLPLIQELFTLRPYNTKFMAWGCVRTLEDAEELLALGVEGIIIDEALTSDFQLYEQLRDMIDYRAE